LPQNGLKNTERLNGGLLIFILLIVLFKEVSKYKANCTYDSDCEALKKHFMNTWLVEFLIKLK
jgi:hypothetical protein